MKINPQQVAKYLANLPQLRPRKLVPHEDKDPRIQLLGATQKFNPRNLERVQYISGFEIFPPLLSVPMQ